MERVHEAVQLADQAMSLAQFGKAPHYCALARRVQGQILLARGQLQDALRAFDSALMEFTRIGSRLEAARARYYRAMVQLTLGDKDTGQSDAESAQGEFAAMGAVHDRARSEQLLRVL